MDGAPGPAGEAVITVVAGRPTGAEVAALMAVLTAVAERPAEDPGTDSAPGGTRVPVSRWRDRAQALRLPLSPGPRAWRRSTRPT